MNESSPSTEELRSCGSERASSGPAPSLASDEEILVFDEAIERMGGDASVFYEVAQVFLYDYPNQLLAAREAITARDGRLASRAAHALKGAVANFGAPRAEAPALELEMEGPTGNWERAEEIESELGRAVQSLARALQRLPEP